MYSIFNGYFIFRLFLVGFFSVFRSVFDFLCFILQHESYESFLLAFCRRFGEEKIEEIKRENILIQKPTLNLRYVNLASETRSKAKAIILLATKLLTIDDINYSSFYFSPSIEDIISDLQKKNENQRNIYTKIEKCATIIWASPKNTYMEE